MNRLSTVALALLSVGCWSRDHGAPDVPRAAVAIALAWTEAGMPSAVVPPLPSPDGGDATQCWNCKGRGKVGDGQTMMTCQACGGSGRSTPMAFESSPVQATPTQAAESAEHSSHGDTSEVSPPPPAEPHDALEGHDAPAVEEPVEWLTWREAQALSNETGRPVLVLQKFRDPADDNACLVCQRLKKTLRDDATLEAFAELGIPCIGYADDWQTEADGTPKATIYVPSIAYVPTGGKPTLFTNFRVAPADAFLADLKAWIDALDQN